MKMDIEVVEVSWGRSVKVWWSFTWRMLIYSFIIAGGILIIFMLPKIQAVYFSRMNRIFNNDQKKWGSGRIIVVVKSYGFYFFKMIFPGVTLMNYPTLIQWGVTEKGNRDAYSINVDFFKGIAAFVATGLIISIPPLRLIGLFIFLGTLQWSAIVSSARYQAARRNRYHPASCAQDLRGALALQAARSSLP